MNLPPLTVAALKADGYDIVRVSSLLPATTTDSVILDLARQQEVVIVTQDLVTNREIVLRLPALLGRPELVRFGDLPYRPGDPMFVCADVRRLRQQTGWQPAYDIDRGLQQTVEWWRNQAAAAE